ncbi:unnamed protein product [Schistosoma rodhaini]|nr:unnamed protein product [Schistosoma rodhaini]
MGVNREIICNEIPSTVTPSTIFTNEGLLEHDGTPNNSAKTLPQPLYLNFKRLALSDYLLAHPKLHNRAIESVRMDLRNFLREYEWCPGCENLVYNAHLSRHLPDDVRAHGPSHTYSAFPLEPYMRQIKKSVLSGYSVAKEAAQRYAKKCHSAIGFMLAFRLTVPR